MSGSSKVSRRRPDLTDDRLERRTIRRLPFVGVGAPRTRGARARNICCRAHAVRRGRSGVRGAAVRLSRRLFPAGLEGAEPLGPGRVEMSPHPIEGPQPTAGDAAALAPEKGSNIGEDRVTEGSRLPTVANAVCWLVTTHDVCPFAPFRFREVRGRAQACRPVALRLVSGSARANRGGACASASARQRQSPSRTPRRRRCAIRSAPRGLGERSSSPGAR